MDDNYYNEVLPRWKFWKEFLLTKLESYDKEFEEEKEEFYGLSVERVKKIKKLNAEIIEKVKKIKSKTDLEKISNEICGWTEEVEKCCNFKDPNASGVYWIDVDNGDKLSNWLALTDFCDMMNKKNEQTEE